MEPEAGGAAEPGAAAARRPRPAPAPAAPEPAPELEPAPAPELAPEPEPELELVPQEPPARPERAGRHARPDPAHAHRRTVPRRPLVLGAAAVVLAAVIAAIVLVAVRDRGGSSPVAAASATGDQKLAAITRTDLANAFLAGATTDIVAVTTYDYRSLDTALSNGEAVATGAYRASFRAALTGSLATEAVRVHRVQTFSLLDAGIGAIAADGRSAKVLIFGIQSVQDDSTGSTPRRTPVTLTATIERQGNRYLVARLSAGVNAGLPAGTAGLRAAAEAGRAEVVAVLTLRHDHFDADYDAALAGAVDPLRASLTSQAAATRARVTTGKYDLAGTVTAVGVQRAAGDTLVLLVAATGTRTAGGKTSVVVDGRYRVTVVRVSGFWVTSAVDPVTS